MEITQVSGPASKTHCLGSSYIFSGSIHSSRCWTCTPHCHIVQSLLFFPPSVLFFATSSLTLPLASSETFGLLFTNTPSLSQGDLNKSACRQFPFYIYNNVSCTALLCSCGTASEHILQILWQGCHCHLPQGFASAKFVSIPHAFTHLAADLIIAGLQCSKLGSLSLAYLIQG